MPLQKREEIQVLLQSQGPMIPSRGQGHQMTTKKVDSTKQCNAIFEEKTVGQLMLESLNELADDLKAGVEITFAICSR
jgi:hypothetical protein